MADDAGVVGEEVAVAVGVDEGVEVGVDEGGKRDAVGSDGTPACSADAAGAPTTLCAMASSRTSAGRVDVSPATQTAPTIAALSNRHTVT
ncbi:MAG: hypothetical protein ACK5MP_13880 [Nostocoides sp.]